MPDPIDLAPLSVQPQAEINRAAAEREARIEASGRDVGIAAVLQTPVASVFNYIDRSPLFFDDEPGFSLPSDGELFKSLTDGVDPDYWPLFADSVSTRHAYYIRNQIDNKQKYREQIQAAGASGMAAATVASMLDPIYLAAGLASGGTSFAASGASRLTQLAGRGLVQGSINVGIEAFRAAEDPAISGSEIALAGIGGALGGVADSAFSGASRGVRFVAGGAAQAAPQAAYDTLSDTDRHDILLNVIPQFFIGGVTNSLHPATRDHAVRVHKAAANAVKEIEREIVTGAGAALTPKGEAYFRQSDQPDFFTAFQQDQAVAPFRAAADRLAGIDPAKKLNRSEVDSILEGTGYKAHNQGFPTPGELREKIEEMARRAIDDTSFTFGSTVGDVAEQSPPPFKSPADTAGGGVTGGAVGAASANDPAFAVRAIEKINEEPGDLNLNGVAYDPASYGARFDVSSRTSRSTTENVGRAANMLGIDHVPKQSGQTYYTVPEWVAEKHNANMGDLLTTTRDAYAGYAKAEQEAGRVPMKERQFREAAKAVYESGNPSGNAHLDRLVEKVRTIRKADWDRMQRHGVAGAVDGTFDPTVIDRYTDRVQLDEAIGIHGYDAMLADIEERIRRHPKNAELAKDPAALRAVAKSWLDNAATQQNRIGIEAAHTLDADSVAIYAAKLRRAVPTLTDAQINDIVYETGPAPNDGATPAKLRRQVRMDNAWENPALRTFKSPVDGQIYSASLARTGSDVSVGTPFKLDDVLLRDIVDIESMNSRYVNGRSGMAEVYRQFSTPERTVESLGGLLDLLKEQGATPDEIDAIEFMAKNSLGIPTHKTTRFTKVARTLRNFSYARVINTATGIRNFGEVAGIVAENGISTMMKHAVPAIRDVIEQMRTGKASSATAIEVYQMGLGLEEINNKMLPQADESDYVPKPGTLGAKFDKKLDVADRAAKKLANLTSTISLVGPTQTVLEHVAARTVSQVWLDFAQGRTTLSNERIKAAGIKPEMVDRIRAEIARPGTVAYDATAAGNVWQGFNWQNWNDVEAATALRQGIIKTVRRQVYRPHASELPMWAQSDIGKVFFQLRTFSFGGWSAKTLHSVKLRDRTAFTSAGLQLLSKGMIYAGLTYLYSLGRSDAEKYRNDRLSTDKIAKAAFSNAEFSSLVPLGVDIAQAAQGKAPVFAFARTTGLGDAPGVTGLLTSNPSADTIDKAFRTAGMPIKKARDLFEYQFGINRSADPRITDKDIKAIQGGLPWQRMFVIDQLFRRLAEAAPQAR